MQFTYGRGHFYFALKGQSYFVQMGQFPVHDRVKLPWLFH